jgi:hypothetical protein
MVENLNFTILVVFFVFFSFLAVSFFYGKAYSEHPLICHQDNSPPLMDLKGGKALLSIIHKQLDLIGVEAMWHTGKIPEQTGLLFDTARKLSTRGGKVCEIVRFSWIFFIKHFVF